MQLTSQPSICVVGAGPSGLATIKNLRQCGLTDVTCFEACPEIGGNWVFRDDMAHSSVYETTHIISSRRLSSFDDYPMPADYPDFPSHAQVLDYFRSYARHFDLLPFVRPNTRVEQVVRGEDGRWVVTTAGPDGPGEHRFDYLLACSGHHWDPYTPDLEGAFSGEQIHAHAYKRAAPFRDRRVLVVGGGNSACDIAAETSRVSRKTCISMRRGYYILPKIIFGMPVDVAYRKLRNVPKPIRQKMVRWALRVAIGRWAKYGLKTPNCEPLEMHPTLNSDILSLIRHGKVHPKGGIKAANGERIVFEDGTAELFDVVIWATGYRIHFPYFDRSFIDWREATQVPLYLKMMMPEAPNLYLIGLFQPIGCIWTLADLQARVAALHITGRLERPHDLAERVAAEMAHPDWHFEKRPRHAVEVDYYDFRRRLLSEIAKAEQPQAS